MSIASQLELLQQTKSAIKTAIQNKGVPVGDEDSFASYADKIDSIEHYGIDTSKAGYQIGAGNIGLYEGRILKGFATMDSKCAFPVVDLNNSDMGVPWNDSFEIGIRFKFTAFPTYQALFGDGNNNSYRRGARIYYSNNDRGFWLCVSTDGSTLAVDTLLSFTPQLDKWYFIKLKFVKSDMKMTVDITEDFETYTNLYDNTLSNVPYYDSSAYLAIGGEARSADMASNTFLIDTFNTYVKDATGSMAWGCFEGQGAEYELYDYIESDGTQVIDLGFAPENGATVTTSFVLLSTQTSEAFVYGATDNSAWLGFAQNPASRNTIYENNTSGRSEAYIKNQQYLLTLTASRNYTNHLCMFGFYLDGYAPGIKTRLCYCKYNDNFYLPCKRKSDGAFGLWDVANQTFLTDSAGGNAFVGGNKIGNIDITKVHYSDYVDGIVYSCIGDYGLRNSLSVEADSELLNATAITFECCARFDSYVSQTNNAVSRIIEFGNSQQSGRLGNFGIKYRSGQTVENNLVYFDDNVSSPELHDVFEWNVGETHTVSCVKKTDGTCKIYADGNLILSTTSTLVTSSSMIDLISLRGMKSYYDASTCINGEVYTWRIYAKALTDEEIAQNAYIDLDKYI